MPGSINGVGTSYSGKSHLHTVQGQCEFCGQQAVLSSYDTTKYFIVLFVPLIPLQKLRVLSQCSQCEKHRVLPLKKWNEVKDQAIVESLGNLKSKPSDPETAKSAIATAMSFQDEPLFQATVKATDSQFTSNAEIQTLIAEGQRYFGHLEESAAAYTKALTVQDTNETRESLATVLLKLGKPQPAAQLLQHINSPKEADRVGYLWLLAAGYQSEGMHREALQVLERMAVINPLIAQGKSFLNMKKVSEKNEATHKRIKSDWLNPKEAAYKDTSLSARLSPYVGPIVFAAILIGYLGSAFYRGNNRKVYVVNGLNVPYTAKLNDKTVKLGPLSRVDLTMPEGEVRVSVEDANVDIPPETVEVSSSFWKRPLFNQTFVINPDRNAFLVSEKQFYAKDINQAPEGEQNLHTGKVLHSFPGLDYEFEEFPATLRTKGGRVISKTRVATYPVFDKQPVELFTMAQESMGEDPEVARKWLLIRQQAEPNNEQWLQMVQGLMGPDEFLTYLKPQLERRPVLINAHRAYQQTKDRVDPKHDLVQEYQGLLDKEPNSAELTYLLGRCQHDTDKSIELFEKAIAAKPPVAYAAYAMAHVKMSQGDFPEALNHISRALELEPGNFGFTWLRKDCWLANKKYDEILQWTQSTNAGPLVTMQLLAVAFQAEALKGVKDGQAEGRLRAVLGQYVPPETVQQLTSRMRKDAEYAIADNGTGKVPAEILEQDVTQMEGMAEEADDFKACLFMYVVNKTKGDDANATKYLTDAIDLMKEGDWDSRKLASILESDTAPPVEEMLKQADEVDSKRIWLVALATRFPSDSPKYLELAKKLNFERVAPYWWLRHWAEQ